MRIQKEFGYDRDNSEKVYEYHALLGQKVLFNSVVAGVVSYKMLPFDRATQNSHPLFRKAWMKYPFRIAGFLGAYWMASQIPNRFFPKFSLRHYKGDDPGITGNSYLHN